jgi:hypothetical protein
LSIATITWARTDREERLLRDALAALARMGMPVSVADGGSGSAFLDFLRRLPNVTLAAARGRGLVAQVKASLSRALEHDTPCVLYTEPDKLWFFEQKLASFVEQATDDEGVGVVLAARSDASFGTYPPLQQYTERTLNHLCGEWLGYHADYTYGPFVMRRALAEHVSSVDDSLGWGWRIYAVGAARRLGYRIAQVVDDFPCPVDQHDEGERERIHRLRQLAENIQGLLLSSTAGTPTGGTP